MLQTISVDIKNYPEVLSSDKIINAVNSQIEKRNTNNVTVDISFLNVLDACKVSMLCATENYRKNPERKISWIVNSKDVEIFTNSMNVGNSEFIIKK
ncbi:hypothetical protein IJI31_06030 [bacterium]|nr:hypothetical protein [bacterium]